MDSQVANAGPRPYNVELITRKAAQAAQIASRRMAEPLEECTMRWQNAKPIFIFSAESRATLVVSSGVYGTSGGGSGQLGGPLRRTARTMESNSSSVSAESPAISMGSAEQGKGLLILRAQKGRRNAGRAAETVVENRLFFVTLNFSMTTRALNNNNNNSWTNRRALRPRTVPKQCHARAPAVAEEHREESHHHHLQAVHRNYASPSKERLHDFNGDKD